MQFETRLRISSGCRVDLRNVKEMSSKVGMSTHVMRRRQLYFSSLVLLLVVRSEAMNR